MQGNLQKMIIKHLKNALDIPSNLLSIKFLEFKLINIEIYSFTGSMIELLHSR